jgi:hypothetical protein
MIRDTLGTILGIAWCAGTGRLATVGRTETTTRTVTRVFLCGQVTIVAQRLFIRMIGNAPSTILGVGGCAGCGGWACIGCPGAATYPVACVVLGREVTVITLHVQAGMIGDALVSILDVIGGAWRGSRTRVRGP